MLAVDPLVVSSHHNSGLLACLFWNADFSARYWGVDVVRRVAVLYLRAESVKPATSSGDRGEMLVK